MHRPCAPKYERRWAINDRLCLDSIPSKTMPRHELSWRLLRTIWTGRKRASGETAAPLSRASCRVNLFARTAPVCGWLLVVATAAHVRERT